MASVQHEERDNCGGHLRPAVTHPIRWNSLFQGLGGLYRVAPRLSQGSDRTRTPVGWQGPAAS